MAVDMAQPDTEPYTNIIQLPKIEQYSTDALTPHPEAQTIPMSTEDEKALYADIADNGVLHPLDITSDGRILDGVNRWKCAKSMNILMLPVIIHRYQEPEEESLHALRTNLKRRHLNEGQKAGLALLMLPYEQALAEKRKQRLGREAANKRWDDKEESVTQVTDGLLPIGSNPSQDEAVKVKVEEKQPEQVESKKAPPQKQEDKKPKQVTDKGEAVEKAAKKSDTSARTTYRAKKVKEKSPERFDAMIKGEISVNKAYQEVQAEEDAQEINELQTANVPLTDQQIMKTLKIKIQPYDVWNFKDCDDRFGYDYPGRIPGQLVAHCLYFWTEQGDTVLDPMVGSGTTIDVCKLLSRNVLAYDAHPRRNDITLHNLAEQGWPDRTVEAKLIFWDPPYFKKVDDGYGDQSISRLSRKEYLDFFDRMAATIPYAFYGRLAFLMSDFNDEENWAESIWLHDYINRFRKHGWHIERVIQVPLPTQQIHADIVKKFQASKRLARLGRELVVMGR